MKTSTIRKYGRPPLCWSHHQIVALSWMDQPDGFTEMVERWLFNDPLADHGRLVELKGHSER